MDLGERHAERGQPRLEVQVQGMPLPVMAAQRLKNIAEILLQVFARLFVGPEQVPRARFGELGIVHDLA